MCFPLDVTHNEMCRPPTTRHPASSHLQWSPCLQSPRVTDAMATLHFSSYQPPSPGRPADSRQRKGKKRKLNWKKGWSATASSLGVERDLFGVLQSYFSYKFDKQGSLMQTFNTWLEHCCQSPLCFWVSCRPSAVPYPLTDCSILDGKLIAVRSTVGQQVLQPRQLSLQHPVLLLDGHDRGHGSGCRETRGKKMRRDKWKRKSDVMGRKAAATYSFHWDFWWQSLAPVQADM